MWDKRVQFVQISDLFTIIYKISFRQARLTLYKVLQAKHGRSAQRKLLLSLKVGKFTNNMGDKALPFPTSFPPPSRTSNRRVCRLKSVNGVLGPQQRRDWLNFRKEFEVVFRIKKKFRTDPFLCRHSAAWAYVYAWVTSPPKLQGPEKCWFVLKDSLST